MAARVPTGQSRLRRRAAQTAAAPRLPVAEHPCAAFRDHRPYAVCAFAGGWVLVLLQWLGAADWVGLLAAAMVAALLRGLALLTGFTLPHWSPGE